MGAAPMLDAAKRVLAWGDLWFGLVALGVALTRPRTVVWFVGLLLAAVGFPLWVIARRQLGTAFAVRARADELVTHGLYARVRHPIYLFGCIAYFGSLLALQNRLWLGLWLALTPIELLRIRREEHALLDRFGEEYRRYRRSTWL
jgi:protein-S-isoprenylcysteine O-methyltransferase Ste14